MQTRRLKNISVDAQFYVNVYLRFIYNDATFQFTLNKKRPYFENLSLFIYFTYFDSIHCMYIIMMLLMFTFKEVHLITNHGILLELK